MADKKIRRRLPLRLKRALQVALGLGLALVGVSYARALLAPNSPGWTLRSAEWVRDNHGGWALDVAEWCWLSLHTQSAAEATQLSVFPVPFARNQPEQHLHPAEPAPIPLLSGKPLPNEGEWRAIGSTVNGVPALRCTMFRPDRTRPNVVVGVARFTPELTRFVLVAGTHDPGGDWNWHGTIPEEERGNLLAAFNAGFRLSDSHGGFYAEGKLAKELVEGAASLVIDRNGAADIIAWTPRRLRRLASVRQNLRLVLEDGQLPAGLSRNRGGGWGRLNHNLYAWRSGLGIGADGALIYLAGEGLNLVTLAKALQRAGAVRAMELDMHRQWPSFNVFQPGGLLHPKLVATKLLKDTRHPAERYLTPDDRDFVAAFVR